jgi:hypothetical protein
MTCKSKDEANKQAAAHVTADREDLARLRALSIQGRGRLIEAACQAAASIYRSRLTAGLPVLERDPWPKSTVDFFRKHAAHVRRFFALDAET